MIEQLWWAPGIRPGSTHYNRLLKLSVSVSYPEFLLKLMKTKWALVRPNSFPPKTEAI